MNYALDTDEIIDYLKGKTETVQKITALVTQANQFFTSAICIAEYLHGAYASSRTEQELAALQYFLEIARVVILPVTKEIAHEYGKIQGTLQKTGRIGSDFDMLIAATCLVHNLTLITGNKKDFLRVKGLLLFGEKSPKP